MRPTGRAALALVSVMFAMPALAQDADGLAKQLSNPVSSLVSVPLQYNVDAGYGPAGDGTMITLEVQPVIPFQLTADWNVISRTILPISFADNIFPAGDVFGLGDTSQSLFFSPTVSGIEGFTWAIGPQFVIPTATDPALGTGKLSLGPTGLLLQQTGPWTIGILASQVWSVAGDPSRPEVSQLFLQPFASYAMGEGQTLSANLEASYDWYGGTWSVPLNLSYSKVFSIGDQPMSFAIGAKKYLVTTPTGPDWGVRSTLTFLFPDG